MEREHLRLTVSAHASGGPLVARSCFEDLVDPSLQAGFDGAPTVLQQLVHHVEVCVIRQPICVHCTPREGLRLAVLHMAEEEGRNVEFGYLPRDVRARVSMAFEQVSPDT